MRTCLFLLAAVAISGAGLTSQAAKRPIPKQNQATAPQKVWSNSDLDALPAKDQLSLVGPAETPLPPAPVGSEAAPLAPASETQAPAPYAHTLDPDWYEGRAALIETELELTDAGLRTAQERLDEAKDRITQPGIDLSRGNVGVTPQEGVTILEQRADAVQNELDGLQDLARENDLPPGAAR